MSNKVHAYRLAKDELARILERYYYLLQKKETLEQSSKKKTPQYIDCLNDLPEMLEKITLAVGEIHAARELSNGEKDVLNYIKKAKKISVKQLAREIEKPYKDAYRIVMVLESLRYVNTKWFPEIQELRVYPQQYEY